MTMYFESPKKRSFEQTADALLAFEPNKRVRSFLAPSPFAGDAASASASASECLATSTTPAAVDAFGGVPVAEPVVASSDHVASSDLVAAAHHDASAAAPSESLASSFFRAPLDGQQRAALDGQQLALASAHRPLAFASRRKRRHSSGEMATDDALDPIAADNAADDDDDDDSAANAVLQRFIDKYG